MRSKIGKTSTIDVKLSNTGIDGAGIFHNIRYTNDNYGGNQNVITFEITNVSGNPIEIIDLDLDDHNHYVGGGPSTNRIKIKIHGTIELGDFLTGLQMILEAEKISDALDPGYKGVSNHAVQKQG